MYYYALIIFEGDIGGSSLYSQEDRLGKMLRLTKCKAKTAQIM